jgi:hypothetical protein
LERPGDTELMGREQLYITSEDRVPEPYMESIYSVVNLESEHGVTMILIHSYFKRNDIETHTSSASHPKSHVLIV